ncbi:MFS transporter [Ideonella livida]|uniref:MFS transporter n=1 Tax=Ideonella livida TaxID=2707176 RepID=A0A7C9PH53_9BURK|nr:MFS transporter [Ideonella livida]NDY91815.1 MFS transporter [Ideonella livida]
MTRTDSVRGRLALMVAHCAGMIDLVALPVWVGTLVARYGLQPQQAGLLATLFLAGAVVASLVVAPRFDRLPGRLVASAGFGVAAAAFATVALLDLPYAGMAVLHAVAGLATGAALSVTHGTIARSGRPHRLFALVGMALGVFAILFLGATPALVAATAERLGGAMLFIEFAGVMAVGAVFAAWAFPSPDLAAQGVARGPALRAPLSGAVWAGMVGLGAMGLTQAMTFSFLERVGDHRGFGLAAVTGVLIALGVVNLFPAALAAVLERRLPTRAVLVAGPLLQSALCAVIMTSTEFLPYAAAASVFAAVMIFTHTFAFGALARLDPTGRALAATPAMLMVGAALGPIVGGTLVQTQGYASLGAAAVLIGLVAVGCFLQVRPERAAPAASTGAPHAQPHG